MDGWNCLSNYVVKITHNDSFGEVLSEALIIENGVILDQEIINTKKDESYH